VNGDMDQEKIETSGLSIKKPKILMVDDKTFRIL